MGKEPASIAGDARDRGLIPGSGRPPGGGHGNPLQGSRLENPTEEAGGLQSMGCPELDTTDTTEHKDDILLVI